MKEENAAKLTALLDQYDQKLAEARKVHEKSMVEEAALIAAFGKVREELVRPVMEDVAKALSDRGHGAEIKLREPSSRSPAYGVGLELAVFPLGYGKSRLNRRNTPRIGFYAAGRNRNKIVVHSRNLLPGITGSTGVQGEYDPEDLSREVIEGEVYRFLKDVFV